MCKRYNCSHKKILINLSYALKQKDIMKQSDVIYNIHALEPKRLVNFFNRTGWLEI